MGNLYRKILSKEIKKMNLTYRKLAMLEKDFIAKEEAAKIEGFYASPVDKDLQRRVSYLLEQVRTQTVV
jgi:hypothetical protein